MPLIHHGQTNDEDYIRYAARRLRAYLRALGVPANVKILPGDEGLYLAVVILGIDVDSLSNIPHQVDGILVMLI